MGTEVFYDERKCGVCLFVEEEEEEV